MKLNPAEYKILELAVDDFFGLWEVIWSLRSVFPGSNQVEIRDIAERALRELLLKGWIFLARRSAISAPEVLIQDNEVNDVLLNEETWREPTRDSMQILVAATEEGERIYYSKDAGPKVGG
jgi:hypothetical protein